MLPAVLAPGATKHLRGRWRLGEALQPAHYTSVLVEGIGAIRELRAEGALFHLLETNHQYALRHATRNRLSAEHECGRARRAVVVDVKHWNAGDTHLVDRALATGAIAIDVASIGLLDSGVIDASIAQRLADGACSHHIIVITCAGLCELNHANAENIYLICHLSFLCEKFLLV